MPWPAWPSWVVTPEELPNATRAPLSPSLPNEGDRRTSDRRRSDRRTSRQHPACHLTACTNRVRKTTARPSLSRPHPSRYRSPPHHPRPQCSCRAPRLRRRATSSAASAQARELVSRRAHPSQKPSARAKRSSRKVLRNHALLSATSSSYSTVSRRTSRRWRARDHDLAGSYVHATGCRCVHAAQLVPVTIDHSAPGAVSLDPLQLRCLSLGCFDVDPQSVRGTAG